MRTKKRVWDKHPDYEVIPSLFTVEECATIIARHEDYKESRSVLKREDEDYRKSDLFWLKDSDQDNDWIFQRIEDLVHRWNAENFNFEVEEAEHLQLTRYNVGDQYDWHVDHGPGNISRRKITVATLVSDPATFEGGEIEFFACDQGHRRPYPNQGDAVIFPSWLNHRVVPVTKGVRWSLINWWGGPPFR